MILSFITNNPKMATYAQAAGIERIMIDLEKKGKDARQSGKGLFLSDHQINDVGNIRKVCRGKALFVRINPINPESQKEIETVIKMGADIIMLPYFHSIEEINTFLKLTNNRVVTSLLVETKEAVALLPRIVDVRGVDEVHIGLNDLSISFGYKTIFEPILNGTMEEYAQIINQKQLPWGFGGIGNLSEKSLPVNPELILSEQLRLGATRGWLGRSFRDPLEQNNLQEALRKEVGLLREFIKNYPQNERNFIEYKRTELLEEIRMMKNKS